MYNEKEKYIVCSGCNLVLPLAVSAQKEREITLNEAIAMARMQSVDAAVALNELKTSYWEYRTFRADSSSGNQSERNTA